MDKLILKLNVNIFLFLLIPSLVLAVSSTDTYETWDSNEGTSTDNVIWVNDDIDFEVNGITDSDADFVCFDWDNDETYDNCYYDSDGCGGGGCNANSCDYYAVPYYMPDGQKTSCNVEGNCREGTNVPERVCDGCDFDTSNLQSTYVDAVVYYDCDNSQSNRHVDTLDEVHFWVVYPKKYDCDSDTGESSDDKSGTDYYDFEGDFGTSWVDIKSDVTCPSYRVCDPDSLHTYHDDQEVTSRTGDITHPCTLEDGTTSNHACSSDNNCYSDNCGQVDVWTITCTFDGSDSWARHLDNKYSSCGGQGYLYDTSDDTPYCSTYLGSDYVCDSDLDGIFNNNYDVGDFCKKDVGESCSQNSDCWNDNGGYDCNNGYCSKCGDSSCTNGEDYSSCPQDCCFTVYDCTGVGGEMGDGTCHSSCDGYQGCDFYNSATKSACDGNDYNSYRCVDVDTRVLCCEGTPSDCASNEYCSSGGCLTCNTQCNDNCQSSACYEDDPDCDSDGNVNGNCGDGVCCQETSVSCPQDCGGVSYCNGTIEVITEDSKGNPQGNLSIYIDSEYNSSTDIYGDKKVPIKNVACGTDYNITVKCENNDICGSKIASIDESDDGNDLDPLLFDCTICKGEEDIYITKDDIRIRGQNGQANITATVNVENVEGSNLNVNFTVVNKDGSLGDSEAYTITSFSKYTKPKASVLLDFTSNSMTVNIYVDPDNDFTQDSKTNNFVSVSSVILETNAYLDIDTGFSNVDSEIEDFLGLYVDSVPSGQEDVKIYASLLNSNSDLLSIGLSKNEWVIDTIGRYVKVNDKVGNKPYNGFVASFKEGSDNVIYVIGTDIEGVIAAVKTLVDERNRFLVQSNLGRDDVIYLGDLDLEAVRVYDYMHNTENDAKSNYDRNSNEFSQIVENALEKQNYDTSIKLVRTTNLDNVTLRIRHLSPQLTAELRNAVIEDDQPVVLAQGIHSSLDSWKDFGIELAQSGRDPWLIEPYGGPGTDTECSPNCPDYDFSDLKTYYWPALIAGVQSYSGENNLSYVGYDLGCTVGLESLELYPSGQTDIGYYIPSEEWLLTDLSDDPIDTFVGVACIGNFSPSSLVTEGNLPFFADYIENNSNTYQDSSYFWYGLYNGHLPGGLYDTQLFIIETIVKKGYFLVFPSPTWAKIVVDVASIIFKKYALFPSFSSDIISMKIYQDIINWINDPTEPRPGLNVNLNNLVVIQGSLEKGEVDGSEGSDLFVSNKDQQEVCNNVNSNNKYYVSFRNIPHFDGLLTRKSLANNKKSQEAISNFLRNKEISQNVNYDFNIDCGELE